MKKRIRIARVGRNGRSFTRLVTCSHARKHGPHLWCTKLHRQLAPEEVLGTLEGVAAFAKWAPATRLFHRRCEIYGTTGEEEENGT